MRSTAARVCALALAAVVFAAAAVRGQCSYNTANTGSWTNGATWAGGAAPPTTSNCSISVTAGVTLTVDVVATAGTVSLADTAGITVSASNGLNCASVAVFGASAFVVASGASLVATGVASGVGGEVQSGKTVTVDNSGTFTVGWGVQSGGTLTFTGSAGPKLLGPATIAGELSVADANGPLLGGGLVFASTSTLTSPGSFPFRGPAANETVTFQSVSGTRTVTYSGSFAGTIIVSGGVANPTNPITLMRGGSFQTAPATIVVAKRAAVFGNFLGFITVQGGAPFDATNLMAPTTGDLVVDGSGLLSFKWDSSAANGAVGSGSTVTLKNLALDSATKFSGAGTVNFCTVNVTQGAGLSLAATNMNLLDGCALNYYFTGSDQGAGVLDVIVGGVNNVVNLYGTNPATDSVTLGTVPKVMQNAPATINVVNCGANFNSGAGFRGTINVLPPTVDCGSNCQFYVQFSAASTHATDRLTLRGYGSGGVTTSTNKAVYAGTLTVPTGGSLQLGTAIDANGGADFLGLTVTRQGTGQIWLGTAFVNGAACGNTVSNQVHGPVAGAQTTFKCNTGGGPSLTMDIVYDWVGDFLFTDSDISNRMQINTVRMTSNSAKLSCPISTPGYVQVGDFEFVNTWTGSCALYVTQVLTSSSPSLPSVITQAPLLFDASNPAILQQSVCQSNCTFASLDTSNAGLSFTLPPNTVMTVNGGSFFSNPGDAGLTLSAGSEFRLASNTNHQLVVKMDAGSIMRLSNGAAFSTFLVDAASDPSARVYIAGMRLPPGAVFGPVQYYGPSAGTSLVLQNASAVPHLLNWAGTLELSGVDTPAPSSVIANQRALPGATLLFRFDLNGPAPIELINVVMPAGSTLNSDHAGVAVTLTNCYIAADYAGGVANAIDISTRGTGNSVLLSSGMVDVFTPGGSLTILNANNADVTMNQIQTSSNSYFAVANAATGNRVFLRAPTVSVGAQNATFDGVVLVTAGDVNLDAGATVGAVYLRNGGGFAADRLQYTVQQALTQEFLQIVAVDQRAYINVNVTNASPFVTSPAVSAGLLQIVGCVVTGTNTLPGFVNITSKGLCPANSDFGGCNDAACNSAAGARVNCTVAQRTHVCGCRTGFVGLECQTNVNDCVGVTCANGGSCVDLVNAYACACVPGYSGPLCQTDINECASMPCDESTTRCVDKVNSFECKSLTCPGNGNCNGHGVCQTGQTVGGDCSCYSGFSGADCSAQAPALDAGVVELSVAGLQVATSSLYRAKTMSLAAFVEALRVGLSLPDGSVTVLSTRPGASGETIVVLNLNGSAEKAAELMTLIANNQGVAATLNIVSGRKGADGVVANGSGLTDNAEKPPVTDGAAIGLVIAGLIVVIIVVALVWYFCANTKDHDHAAPKTRPSSNSNAGQTAAVELQVR